MAMGEPTPTWLWTGGTISTTTAGVTVYNGMCHCRGSSNPHPFHTQELPTEYVGRHRKEA